MIDFNEIDLLDEGTMAEILPDIFDGSLSESDYYYQKEEYEKYVKPIQEYLEEINNE